MACIVLVRDYAVDSPACNRLLARVVICGIVIFKANGTNWSHGTTGGECVMLRQTNETD